MLTGTWTLTKDGNKAVKAGQESLSFSEDGRCRITQYGNTTEAQYRYDEGKRTITLLDGGQVLAEVPLTELSEDRMVGKFGPNQRTYERGEPAAEAPTAPPTIWSLSAAVAGCDADVLLNGFRVLRCSADSQSASGVPVNSLLIGPGNRLEVVVRNRGEHARVQVGIEVAAMGQVVEVPGPSDLRLEGPGEDCTLTETFDAPVAAFAEVLDLGRAVPEADAMAFALALRDVLRAGDADQARSLLGTQVRIHAAGFGVPESMIQSQLAPMIDALAGAELAFEADVLEVEPHCEGKVVEVCRAGGEALLSARDPDGSTLNCRLFLADLGEGPCWLR